MINSAPLSASQIMVLLLAQLSAQSSCNLSRKQTPMMNVSEIYASYLESTLIGVQREEANLYVVRALRHVIQDVFAQLSPTLMIMAATRSSMLDTWFQHVIGVLLSTWSDGTVQMLRANGTQSVHVPGRKYCNLLLVDSYESLLDTRIAEDNAGYDDHEYYFIFLQTRDQYIERERQLILEYCLAHYWLNCNVMVQTAQVEVLVYSYYPYQEQRCQLAEAQLVNRFDGQRMINAPMFPNKLRQLSQCPLTLLLWHMPPYVELSPGRTAGGFEMQLVQHLAQRLNFSLVLHKLHLLRVDQYKLAMANGSINGPIELIMQQRVNMSIGYFRKTARRDQLMTSTPAHYYAPLVAVVESDNFRFGRLAWLTFPFQWPVWQTLLAALLLHWSVYVWHWRRLGLQVVELLLGVAVPRLPRCWLQRLVYAHWLLGSIPLRIIYQSLLFHFMRLQLFETLPSSFEQLLSSNFRAFCTSNTLQMLREMPQVDCHYDSFTGFTTSYDQNVLDALQHNRSIGRRSFAIAGLDVTKAHLRDTGQEENYHILTQYVNVQQVVIYMPKHTYFYSEFTNLIRRLDASGFIDFWRRATFAESVHRNQRRENNEEELQQQEHRRRIHETQLTAIYGVMGSLYAIAALIFCLELLIHRLFNKT
ncbi:uncharacterized protein LOC117578119 isoform X2 [Drosophila albomicans]|uniref:Uncharacterized protein LOC117578119 isoform X2 n=1 Tax=Drosophila albomicans TaxID=7291 RepID=A0A6P8Y6U0_DROAB|nr:uncharacterized protein LOC117578119 isoform X2 [Drosophila albomicans]